MNRLERTHYPCTFCLTLSNYALLFPFSLDRCTPPEGFSIFRKIIQRGTHFAFIFTLRGHLALALLFCCFFSSFFGTRMAYLRLIAKLTVRKIPKIIQDRGTGCGKGVDPIRQRITVYVHFARARVCVPTACVS